MFPRKTSDAEIQHAIRHYNYPTQESSFRLVSDNWSTADILYAMDRLQTDIPAKLFIDFMSILRKIRDERELRERHEAEETARERRHKELIQHGINPANITYHFHGHNARINTNSTDQSVNTVNLSEADLFLALKKAMNSIDDAGKRKLLTDELGELETTEEPSCRKEKYLKFIQHAASHMSILSPFISALATWTLQ